MPNRILKDSIATSENLNACSVEAQMLFIRLITKADDYGLFEARPAIVRAYCYPLLLDKVSEADIRKWLSELERNNLVRLYEHDGIDYMTLVNWERHQRIRNQHSKYPAPNGNLRQPAADCCGVLQVAAQSESNPIQSNLESNIYTVDSVSRIFDHWNEQKIIRHRKLTEKQRGRIKTALATYSEQEIVDAISIYAEILHSDDYRWTYTWALEDFVQRGLSKFTLPAEVVRENNRDDKSKRPGERTQAHYETPEEIRARRRK
jgi:hypothetical protein